MWESENQDESPLMTTDNFHGIDRLALETIATSDAAYHDINHTIMVTLVGQEILRGRHISVGSVTPRDWLHFIVSLLCHDIGYVRGVGRGDADGQYVTKFGGRQSKCPGRLH